ncbi:hypothetical protein LCGC14_0629560 [marine sediment metagenome]|uniref:Putative regulatory protein FmdB zinc ribbon domain-containing protein n=1 Tax=marine sediment metagenome TaxID=412755 RepID=A0A0F9TNZ6_9ZZZZ
MPLYDFRCSDCGNETEVLLNRMTEVSCECGSSMEHRFSAPPMIKITGEGGYPSRRKQVRNTTFRDHPQLEHDPKRVYF